MRKDVWRIASTGANAWMTGSFRVKGSRSGCAAMMTSTGNLAAVGQKANFDVMRL